MKRIWTSFTEFWLPRDLVEDRAQRVLNDIEHQLFEARLALATQEGIVEGLEYRRLVALKATQGVDSSPVPGHNVAIVPGN